MGGDHPWRVEPVEPIELAGEALAGIRGRLLRSELSMTSSDDGLSCPGAVVVWEACQTRCLVWMGNRSFASDPPKLRPSADEPSDDDRRWLGDEDFKARITETAAKLGVSEADVPDKIIVRDHGDFIAVAFGIEAGRASLLAFVSEWREERRRRQEAARIHFMTGRQPPLPNELRQPVRRRLSPERLRPLTRARSTLADRSAVRRADVLLRQHHAIALQVATTILII